MNPMARGIWLSSFLGSLRDEMSRFSILRSLDCVAIRLMIFLERMWYCDDVEDDEDDEEEEDEDEDEDEEDEDDDEDADDNDDEEL